MDQPWTSIGLEELKEMRRDGERMSAAVRNRHDRFRRDQSLGLELDARKTARQILRRRLRRSVAPAADQRKLRPDRRHVVGPEAAKLAGAPRVAHRNVVD